jgi:hypothetical protein
MESLQVGCFGWRERALPLARVVGRTAAFRPGAITAARICRFLSLGALVACAPGEPVWMCLMEALERFGDVRPVL